MSIDKSDGRTFVVFNEINKGKTYDEKMSQQSFPRRSWPASAFSLPNAPRSRKVRIDKAVVKE